MSRLRRGGARVGWPHVPGVPLLPLTTFLAWSMHVAGIDYLIKEPSRYRRLEFGLLAVHTVLYLGAMVYFLVRGPR